MAIDTDLSALLPDPPPPRPARREAAIDAALRRFDGAPAQAPARPAATSRGWGRPQIAALASVALVVLVSVPVWWAERDRIAPRVPAPAAPAATTANGSSTPPLPQPAAPAPGPQEPSSVSVAVAPAAPAPIAPAGTPLQAPSATSPAAADSADARAPIETALNRLPALSPRAAPAPPPPPPAVSAPRAGAARRAEAETAAEQSIVVTGSRIERQGYNSTTPMVTVDEEALEAAFDWSACTLADPRQDVNACRGFADPAARGAKGRAGTQLAEGLRLAWQGDLDRAIAAFDRAIDAVPDLSIAYVNRGLAYQQRGDLRRALADFDRAIARDPRDARAFYHRSQLQRARGDTRRADADARRAIELSGN